MKTIFVEDYAEQIGRTMASLSDYDDVKAGHLAECYKIQELLIRRWSNYFCSRPASIIAFKAFRYTSASLFTYKQPKPVSKTKRQ